MIIYLGCPYTHPSPAVREDRFEKVCAVTVRLMRLGHHIFSPIVHCHPLAVRGSLPTDISWWEEYDRKFLSISGEFWILTLDGWEDSEGLKIETKMARHIHIPVRMIGLYDNKPHGA